MDDLVLHDATNTQLKHFVAAPSHAVLLNGPDGIGKTAIAEGLVCELLHVTADKLFNYPHFRIVSADGNSISIEMIRNLQKFLQLKTIGTAPLRRAVIIEHAQALTTEAQNAFLKLLEEPPADTLMILTVDSPRSLLPTILSRTQVITVAVPTQAQLAALMTASGKDEATQRQAYFLSGGLPGLLCALLAGDEAHPLLGSVGQAKALLQKSTFERMAIVDGLSKQKESAQGVVSALERIAEAMLAQAAAKGETARIKQWHRIRKLALEAREGLEHSANAKLTLSNLFLHL
jgi:replication-associated recombination protein RarA